MSSILEQLDIKPVPKTKDRVKIVIPGEGAVPIRINVVDRTGDDFDRDAIMAQLKLRGLSVPKMKQKATLKVLTEALVKDTPVNETEEVPDPLPKKKGKIKIKKLGRIKIKGSKNIKKGTITTLAETGAPSVRVKLPKKISLRRSEVPPSTISFEKELNERLPEAYPQVNIRAGAYYQNNREIFVNFINSLFAPYKDKLTEESKTISCESMRTSKSGAFALLTHQAIVRDYINLYTPYRGLLLYHGLGAGKTCASIAIAEGFQNPMHILVMTPASLRQNYQSEIKKCGNEMYRLNQYWEFIPNDNNTRKTRTLAKMLGLSEKFVRDHKGAWFVNVSKEANYESLETGEKFILNQQIDEMIRSKYQFLNYNGLQKRHLDDLTNDGKTNPFENKVVIIDEAHNFVSRIVNKLKKPDSLSMKLYNYLLSAENCRIVMLTGTPIINYPNELGILFNILRGYIRTYRFTLSIKQKGKVNQKTIEGILGNFNVQDYMEYNPSSYQLVITRNPFGFANIKNKSNKYEGVRLDRQGNMTTKKFISVITSRLEDANIGVVKVNEDPPYKALPDTLDAFKAMFINPKDNSFKNTNLFKRRVLGLTSYFRSATEDLMPRFDIEKDLIVEMIPMSDYQFGIYEIARGEERKMALGNARKQKKSGDGGSDDSSSTYRIFSRAFCNFVFPPEISRPKPKEGEQIATVLGRDVNEDILDIISLQEEIANVDGKYEEDDRGSIEEVRKQNIDSSYEKRIQDAIQMLKSNASKYLSPTGLAIYSPKFLTLYENIINKAGLHLIYSQFRTLEGIGIFSMVLDQNGFAQFKIAQDSKGLWRIIVKPGDEDKPKYALYTGTETTEVKEMMRLIFNGLWDKLPDTIKDVLNETAANNNHGEIIKVFMITSSGAEGISLKNTRYVHIMEPYWHPVRMEQVIGRARRICSHEDLPEDEKQVNVFLYLMKFTDKQLIPVALSGGMASKGLLEKDVSKLDKTTPLTSDQALYEISTIKEELNKQLLTAVKESAFDCALHAKAGDKEPLICMSFGTPMPTTFVTKPALTVEMDYDKEQLKNMKKISWKARVVNISGKKYAFKADKKGSKTGEIYDLESYKRGVRRGGQAILVGRLVIDLETKKLAFRLV
jgi:hypothetical protein